MTCLDPRSSAPRSLPSFQPSRSLLWGLGFPWWIGISKTLLSRDSHTGNRHPFAERR